MNRFKALVMEKVFVLASNAAEAAIVTLENFWEKASFQVDYGLQALSTWVIGDVLGVLQSSREQHCVLHVEVEFVGTAYRLTEVNSRESWFGDSGFNESEHDVTEFDSEGVRCVKLRYRRDDNGTRLVFRRNVANPEQFGTTVMRDDSFEVIEIWVCGSGCLRMIGDHDFVFNAQTYDGAKFTVSTPWGDKIRVRCQSGIWSD